MTDKEERKLRVFIASSWKNRELVRSIANELKSLGFEVYDFTDEKHFVFNITEDTEKARSEINWIECGQLIPTQLACETDKAGLDWADVGILLLPSGRSAHMEAGILIGQGKPLIIYGTLPRGGFEIQYNLTPHRYRSEEWSKVIAALSAMKPLASSSQHTDADWEKQYCDLESALMRIKELEAIASPNMVYCPYCKAPVWLEKKDGA